MPNYVYNRLQIKCCAVDMARIKRSSFTDENFNFNKLIPQPLHIYTSDISSHDSNDFGEFTWYQWRVNNWGTKWNAGDNTNSFKEGIFTIKFTSAWTIPYPVIIAFANKFQLDFVHEYIEEQPSFWGQEHWKGGKRISCEKDAPRILKKLSIELYGSELTIKE